MNPDPSATRPPRKRIDPRLALALVALVLLIVAAVVGRPDWLRLKPATGTAQAMAAAGELDRGR